MSYNLNMALDGIILSKVKEDLDKYLPIRINRIMQTSKTEVVFNVHANSLRTNLVINLHSNFNHICLSDRSFNTYNDPSTFVMVLRKYIINGVIDKIEQFDYDRYLLLHIHSRNEFYDEQSFILSVELMGKYANLILVDENNKIVDALKKIPPYENTKRTILPGAIFTLPEKQNKLDPYNNETINFDESLVNQISGFSKSLEKEIRYRLIKEPYSKIIEDIKNSNKLYITRIKDTYDFHIIPLTNLSIEYEEYDIQKGFDLVYKQDDEKERIKSISDDLFKVCKRQIKHFDSKLIKLNQSLEDANNLTQDKTNGDVLYTYYNLNEKGLKSIDLDDYEGNKITIKLDPKLSIKQNANKYYQQYQKKRKGKTFILEQIQIASDELEYFKNLYEQLSYANYTDALDIKEELSKYGYLKKQSNKTNSKKKKINLYQVKVDGYIITFGKNNIQNNYLTFDYAKSNYTWFHTKQFHGCHLVCDSDELPENILRICANLAAYYSSGRLSSSVPVDYTLVKNIKKVKGTKPGFITFKNYKTIYIDPIEDKNLVINAI